MKQIEPFLGVFLFLIGISMLCTFHFGMNWYMKNIPNDFIMGILVVVSLLCFSVGIILISDYFNHKAL